jgi:transposase-like protein
MAKKKVMTMEEALQAILAAGEENPFRPMLEFICQSALELEMAEHLGAQPYERTGDRLGYRNGYKPRMLYTAVGTLNLLVPQDRDGTFSTALFERYQRSDKALVLAMMEMYVKGVSTRKVAAITEKLCGRSFSGQQVSKLAKNLDQETQAWRSRPIEGDHPYLLVDARYEKIRQNGRVTSKGVLIVVGIDQQGRREILSVEVANSENATTWSDLFRRLKKRGLSGVLLVTSDDHEGIKAATRRYFQGASWQRCQFHFIRNTLALAAKGEKQSLHADLRDIFDAPDFKSAMDRIEHAMQTWICQKPAIADKIDEDIADCLSCFAFPEPHRKRIRTTNCLERLNQEIRRRTRVVRIFPNDASALRLITALAIECSEEWETGRQYLDMGLLKGWQSEMDEEDRSVLVLLTDGAASGGQK